jgi:transposase-like protein
MSASIKSGLSRHFTDRKIATKVGMGFACVLVITAVLAATAYLSLSNVQHNFEMFGQRASVAAIARDYDRSFLQFRRFVREYSHTGTDSDYDAAVKARDEFKIVIGKALEEIKNPERAAKTKDVAEQFAIYAKHFEKMGADRREQNSIIREQLDPQLAEARRASAR